MSDTATPLPARTTARRTGGAFAGWALVVTVLAGGCSVASTAPAPQTTTRPAATPSPDPSRSQATTATPSRTPTRATTTSRPATTSPGKTKTTSAPSPARPAAIRHRLPDGVHYGFVRRVEGRDVTIDVIDWFTGAAATRACREDGVPVEPQEWCHDYYYRNHNPLLRTFTIPRGMDVSILGSDSSTDHEVSVAAFARRFRISSLDHAQPFHFRTVAGRITDLTEQFTP